MNEEKLTKEQLKARVNMRCERFINEYKMNAPSIIIKKWIKIN